VAADVPVKFRNCISICSWVIKLCQKNSKWRLPLSWIVIW